jgi:L-iditol 2-dehydrogenase
MWVQTLTAPGHFERREMPVPLSGDLRAGEVIVRLVAGAICGSDLPNFRGKLSQYPGDHAPGAANLPGFPLHEVVGEIVESNGTDLEKGTRVVGWAIMSNGLAEFFVGAAEGLIPIDLKHDATSVQVSTIQPLACVLNAVDRIPSIEGKWVAVIGQGPIGLLFSHVMKSRGAARVTGIDEVDRSDVAARFGIDEVVCSSSNRWVHLLSESERPDIVVEAVGHQVATLNDAVEAVAPAGYVYYFGIPDDPCYPFNFQRFMRKNLTLASGSTWDRRYWLKEGTKYADENPDLLKDYVTHVFSTRDTQAAYELANVPAVARLKVGLIADE